ncbi:MAG: pirin family protein [Hyphomicrobium aestuarii]|nr:pirin family protein [Hyphomicrobium aestuarii]
MSSHDAHDPKPGDRAACALIEQVIVPRARDLGGFEVRRALPAAGKQMVGPFIFFDQMGPSEFLLGAGIDVRPHPHIGLSTVTYLFEGEIFHRDSLGTSIPIRPGALNLMTAGRGIVHSERTGPDVRRAPHQLYGIQAWAALPASHEETAPAFVHHAADALPVINGDGVTARVILGQAFGATSPAVFPHPALYVHAEMAAGSQMPLDATYDERAVYIVSGTIEIAGDSFEGGRLLVFKPGDAITILAKSDARLMIVGGEPMDGPRHIWWNFVSSRKDRIDAAKADWTAGRFDTVPGDEAEFIPLPG